MDNANRLAELVDHHGINAINLHKSHTMLFKWPSKLMKTINFNPNDLTERIASKADSINSELSRNISSKLRCDMSNDYYDIDKDRCSRRQ